MSLPHGLTRRWIPLACAALCTAIALSGCGGGKDDKSGSQVAAKVNSEEVKLHQINLVLQQQRGLKQDQVDAASRAILERLIDQELAVQKAKDLKLDRDPRVVLEIEAARRDVVARAYAQKLAEGAAKPTPEEVKKYYDENPNLFSARRIYQLQEVIIEAKPDQVPDLRERVKAAKDMNEFVEYLKAQNFKYNILQGVRAAEQLPLANLPTFAAMKDGEAIVSPIPNGARVVALAASRSHPVDLETARPIIETALHNDRKRKLISDDLKALRSAAKIQYAGTFAQAASAAASAPAADALPISVLAPSGAASGAIDPAALGKDPAHK